MKREDVKNKIPGITEEQLNWLMQENGSDITREKSAAAALQTQLNSAQAQLKTAQDGLKAFDGVDVAGLQAQVTKLQADMQAQADGFAFDSALNTAILGKKGRSVDAVRALLDLDALKGSKDRTTDINKALEDAVKANPWAFGEQPGTAQQGAGTYSTGSEHGDPMHGGDDTDPVETAFKNMNPNIADKYGMTVTNEAVNGATLAPNITDNVNGGIRTCISTVVTSSTALAKADYILLEGGVNDAWNKAPVGTLTDGFAATYDETTMTGALEKMLEYLAKNYSDKRVAYVFPHGGLFGSSENWYKTYKPAILAALQKWGVPYVDIAESTPPMGGHGISGLSGKYTGDGTHPNKAGYERFYVEPIAALLKRL